ncbi:MAG: hypothetical protein ACSLE9_07980 [Burkholderiaceae bacterium]
MTFAPLPGAYINWDESAEPLASFLRYSVYRRLDGDTGDGTRIATITDRSLTTYTDYQIGSDDAYEYNITQTIDNGAEELESEFGEWLTALLVIESVFVHSVPHPEIYAEFLPEGFGDVREQDIVEEQAYRRAAPTSFIGPRDQGVAQIPWSDSWIEGSEQWAAVRRLMAAQAAGDTLMIRNTRDIRMFGAIHAPSRSHSRVMYAGAITFRENHYEEAR